MLAHTGVAPGGSQWCALHKPVELLSILLHDSEEAAIMAECASYNLWSGRLKDEGGHNRVRGGRINGIDMPFAPRGWPREKTNLVSDK